MSVNESASDEATVIKNAEKKYPIAEIFTSPQGEGLYAGAMMTFIRLGGCSVGKKLPSEFYGEHATARHPDNKTDVGLPIYTEECCTWDGRHFLCDTDFRTKEVLTSREILQRVPTGVERICITGGEPLNHDLTELFATAWEVMLDVHIETSGTVPIQKAFPRFDNSDLIGEAVRGWLWLCVSPKLGCLDSMIKTAQEIKFLVDENFSPDRIPLGWKMKHLTYLQPINGENELNIENMKLCLEWQKQFPHWRISSQSHKLWGVQ